MNQSKAIKYYGENVLRKIHLFLDFTVEMYWASVQCILLSESNKGTVLHFKLNIIKLKLYL